MSRDEDCRNPVCKDDPFGAMRRRLIGDLDDQAPVDCPLDRIQLGHYSWSLMHTFAAHYPENPTEHHKKAMKGFLQGFKILYPCTHCRQHFQTDYNSDPPNMDSHRQLNEWVCRQHNRVNHMLGKPKFDCQYDNLIRRWKTGCEADDL